MGSAFYILHSTGFYIFLEGMYSYWHYYKYGTLYTFLCTELLNTVLELEDYSSIYVGTK
jgi:hypothetical protein